MADGSVKDHSRYHHESSPTVFEKLSLGKVDVEVQWFSRASSTKAFGSEGRSPLWLAAVVWEGSRGHRAPIAT